MLSPRVDLGMHPSDLGCTAKADKYIKYNANGSIHRQYRQTHKIIANITLWDCPCPTLSFDPKWISFPITWSGKTQWSRRYKTADKIGTRVLGIINTWGRSVDRESPRKEVKQDFRFAVSEQVCAKRRLKIRNQNPYARRRKLIDRHR